MANTYLSRTQGTATLGRKYTFSCWIKRSKITDRQQFIRTTGYGYFEFQADDKLHYYDVATGGDLVTNKVFRDTNAWYHIVLSVDTTLATADDRHKIYINGVQETSFADRTNPTQNNGGYFFDDGRVMYIGSNEGSNLFFNGCISHLHGIDGTAYDASAFGSFDNDTGEWSINTSPSVTYGNNGFFILKDGNSVTDQSGNSNNFTVAGGTLTKTEDCPSNVFATWNPLVKPNDYTLSQGNNTIAYGSSSSRGCCVSNLGMSSGKYYFELKVTANSHAQCQAGLGIVNQSDNGQLGSYPNHGGADQGAAYYFWDGSKSIGQTGSTYGSAIVTGDIVSCAYDIDNKALYFRINSGSWQDSGDPTSGANKTGGIDFSSITDNGFWFINIGDGSGSNTFTASFNFGNGYFGTTAVSSAGTNASGNGIFEYDVPTGYTALSTKGLNL